LSGNFEALGKKLQMPEQQKAKRSLNNSKKKLGACQGKIPQPDIVSAPDQEKLEALQELHQGQRELEKELFD